MRRLLVAAVLVSCAACNSNKTTAPSATTTTTTAPAQNRNPVITSTTVSPSFGIADLTTFTFASIASDPDGDALTYTWNIAGNAATGANPTPRIFISPGGNGTATVTVTDGRGGSATANVNFIVGSMQGRWNGTMPNFTMVYNFTQSSTGTLSATWTVTGTNNASGLLDPASPNNINGNGRVTFRSKPTSAGFLDFTITGDMDTTGTRIVGSVSGSGLNGQVIMVKQ